MSALPSLLIWTVIGTVCVFNSPGFCTSGFCTGTVIMAWNSEENGGWSVFAAVMVVLEWNFVVSWRWVFDCMVDICKLLKSDGNIIVSNAVEIRCKRELNGQQF